MTIAIPVSDPSDFYNTTTNELVVNGGDDPKNPGLRIKGKIKKSLDKHPNTSELIITNLSPDTRSSLQKKGVKVFVEAGYQSVGVSSIFRGDVRTTDHVRNGADWDTTMRLADGERSFRFARVNESFAAGTGAGNILRFLANKTGLQIGNIPQQAANITKVFDQGYTVHGPVWRSLDTLARSLGYTLSIQAETIQILLPGKTLNDNTTQSEVPDITPDTGLIGSPEVGTPEKKGKPALVKFKTLLRPASPGAIVRLRSERYDGFLRCKICEFEFDTHGNEWYTEVEGVIIGAA